MAFPVPTHLPRRQKPQDVSSQILSKMDAATNKTLNSALVASWVAELEQTIQSTKQSIHERIQSDLPAFQRQLAASRSVQERLRTLTTNVDGLNDSVSNPETGLIPTVFGELTLHANLAQQATNVRVEFETLSHLHKCATSNKSLESLIDEGKLPEASEACKVMKTLLDEAPNHLNDVIVMEDLRRQFHAAQSRNEEQLSEAYTRSVISLHQELIINLSVQVRQSETLISLSSIFASLSQSSLSNHLTTLRRDLTHQFDYILKQPSEVVITSSGTAEHKFSLIPSPPNEENRINRLENLSSLFTFLSTHLLQCLPSSHKVQFTLSLCKPTTTSILNNLLIPFLPSSFDDLPPFLELLQRAVDFEDNILLKLLCNDPNDRPVKAWADSVDGHYERQRRMQILDRSRDIIVTHVEPSDTFLVEVNVGQEPTPAVVAYQDEETTPVEGDAWGLDQDSHSANENGFPVEDDSWGFDDEVIPDEPTPSESEVKPTLPPVVKPAEPSPSPEILNGVIEPDPSEAWGWNDDDDAPPTDEAAWDDPWGDVADSSVPESPSDSRPPPAPSIPSPKVATRLEKAAKKGKKQDGNGSTSPTPSPVPAFEAFSSPKISTPASTSLSPIPSSRSVEAEKRPSQLDTRPVPRETYSVSGSTKRIISLVEDVLSEGKHLAASSLFGSSSSKPPSSSSGSILLLTAPGVIDLYRALYPVKFGKELANPERGMRFSNDCTYLAQEVARLNKMLPKATSAIVGERMDGCMKYFKLLSESWYHDVIQREQEAVDKTLTEGASGFTYTAEQERYDECENAIMKVLQQVRRFAQQLKDVLPKSKYYTAVGMVANTALSCILTDMLALPDITEIESHRLSELCRIFSALEGLFVEDPAQPSFVVAYVPSWLKFSYLSELLEASMADITYLFEEGALVDFQVDELVRLVQALFADTQLRTNTIAKLMGGHPVPVHQ